MKFLPATAAPLAGLCLLLGATAAPAVPFSSATITRVENKVLLGERQTDRSVTRPAAENDVMQPRNFLRSETDSRAELQYPDGTVVRVGQNTVFTFDSGSRTLTLDRGSLLFHIPKNSGGGTIKTASLTAAITGTAGKVSDNIIAIVDGEVKLVPSGRIVHAGEFARRNGDGSITIAAFDKSKVLEGKLVHFHGKMPGFPEEVLVAGNPAQTFNPEMLRDLEVQSRTQNQPGTVNFYIPKVQNKPVKVVEEEKPTPRREQTPVATPFPTRPSSGGNGTSP